MAWIVFVIIPFNTRREYWTKCATLLASKNVELIKVDLLKEHLIILQRFAWIYGLGQAIVAIPLRRVIDMSKNFISWFPHGHVSYEE